MGDKDEKDSEDVLFMGPDLKGDVRPFVRRKPGHGFEAGLMRPVKDGEPIGNDAVFLEHKGPGPIYKVSEVFQAPNQPARSKPTTENYREGWDRIFENKAPVGQA